MIEITRQEEFSAAHRLFRPDWSEEQNEALYGKCANPHYHGHNYVFEVTLRCLVNPDTGMAYNLADLKKLMRREIVEALDHKNLNEDAAGFLKNRIPTAENIAISIWECLAEYIDSEILFRVRLYENERNFVDYYGENPDGVR
ncbi:MAG: 6-carboxytetrahydropterin synthase [Nitrospinae bacterium]|nr:6-carboxytetrahydropterin synthase [Nitrospinota bacterium]